MKPRKSSSGFTHSDVLIAWCLLAEHVQKTSVKQRRVISIARALQPKLCLHKSLLTELAAEVRTCKGFIPRVNGNDKGYNHASVF